MADYVVTYTFYIDERKRPENFPHEVFIIDHWKEIKSAQDMAVKYNNRFTELASANGIVVFLDQNIDMTTIQFNHRVYIPWHMITHSRGEVNMIPPQEPKILLEAMVPTPEPEPNKNRETIQ